MVSVPKKLLVTLKDGPEETLVPLTVVVGIVKDAAFALEAFRDVVININPAVANESFPTTFCNAECGFLKMVEMEDMVNIGSTEPAMQV
jgi:hypothetical protein